MSSKKHGKCPQISLWDVVYDIVGRSNLLAVFLALYFTFPKSLSQTAKGVSLSAARNMSTETMPE